jgi:hypothetical protein
VRVSDFDWTILRPSGLFDLPERRLVLRSILLLRLFTQPALPAAPLPTIAIELAPPVVAANAWFAMTGNRLDTLVMALAGYAVLMVMVQLDSSRSTVARRSVGVGGPSRSPAPPRSSTQSWLAAKRVAHGVARGEPGPIFIAPAQQVSQFAAQLVERIVSGESNRGGGSPELLRRFLDASAQYDTECQNHALVSREPVEQLCQNLARSV